MFSGIIEAIGSVEAIAKEGKNKTFTISSDISNELKIDQSVAHNGVCLTVVKISDTTYDVTAVDETLNVSNLGQLKVGHKVNLERSLKLSDRVDGHIVQGHVDAVSRLIQVFDESGSWRFRFSLEKDYSHLVVQKGSICINGISLTIAHLAEEYFEVAIIPYTYDHTNLHQLKAGDHVNIEFDILGKYIARYLSIQKEKS